jgi:hypothetical protein
MFAKQQQGTGRVYSGFLIGVVSLAFLSLSALGAETQGSKKAEQQTESQKQVVEGGMQGGWRAGKIIDQIVKNAGGEELGEVDDLIISRDGKVEQIILSVGGFLGMDEKLVELPFTPLKITDRGIVYNVGKQELKDRPAFRYGGK